MKVLQLLQLGPKTECIEKQTWCSVFVSYCDWTEIWSAVKTLYEWPYAAVDIMFHLYYLYLTVRTCTLTGIKLFGVLPMLISFSDPVFSDVLRITDKVAT